MKRFFKDLWAYLKAVFSIYLVLLDILGIFLVLYDPIESYSRIIGGILLLLSFLVANFRLYRELTEQISDQADLRLSVVEETQHFGYLRGRHSSSWKGGFNEQGLPDGGSLQVIIRIINNGSREGALDWELDLDKTELWSLFDKDQINIPQFLCPKEVAKRDSYEAQLIFDIKCTEQAPHVFAQSLGNLIKFDRQYRVVLRYSTKHWDGSKSDIRELHITGDFQKFYNQVLEYWDNPKFHHLADIACNTAG
jgi:hypothetical protein